ncbi:restriction endonuclease subunit S [Sorangium sp. So ce1000]|uniref:restriction endonuclease subunit S n=1 Tax=Sorangium sp. So ce1000 TaxID=3133325 RepID=UPI003F63DF99
MSDELREGWASVKVGSLFECWGGMTPSTTIESYWGGTMPWISSKDVKAWTIGRGTECITPKALAETRLRVCPIGCVLIVVRSGVLAHTLPVALTTAPLVVNQDVKVLTCGNQHLNEWLAIYLRAHQREILEANRKDGTTVQSIRVQELLAREMPVPPLAEQRRIVDKVEALLERVDRARARLDRVPRILKRFRQAVLAAACSGELTREWRKNQPNVRAAKLLLSEIAKRRADLALPTASRPISDEGIEIPDEDLPDSWVWCRVGQIADVRLGGTPSRKDASYWNGSIPWVSSGEVANCRIGSTKERITKKGLENSNAKLYPAGSVLIAMIGEGKTRGQAAVLDIEASTNQNVAGLIFDAGMINFEYVWYWALQEYVKNRDEGRGGNQAALNGAKVRALPLPLPPLEEQDEIVRVLKNMLAIADTIERRLETVTRQVEKIPQAILSKAFLGELVPTEAELARIEGRTFESAQELLKRVHSGARQPPPVQARGRRKAEETPTTGANYRGRDGAAQTR